MALELWKKWQLMSVSKVMLGPRPCLPLGVTKLGLHCVSCIGQVPLVQEKGACYVCVVWSDAEKHTHEQPKTHSKVSKEACGRALHMWESMQCMPPYRLVQGLYEDIHAVPAFVLQGL